MNENTNDVSKNGENSDSAKENTAAKVPPEKKKKERDRELPDWMLDKTTVNELIFSRMFLGQHPMKCIKGVFYDYDGVVDDDMQMSALPSTGYLKNLVTAEIPIDVEAKGKQSEQALLYTRLLCFGNGNPKALYDRSKCFSRRMIILTTQTPPESRVIDPHIADKFLAEKNKIFCWMFDGLRRLIENRYRFTISERAKQNVRETMQDNCNITEFLEDTDRVMYGENYCVTSSKLYDCYTRWCEDNALTSLKRETGYVRI